MKLQLPVMQCDDGCGECCGIVPATQKEFDRVMDYAAEHGIKPAHQGKTCPWFQEGRCTVYEVRPLVCRLFGHTRLMTCPRGYNVNIPDRKVRRAVERQGRADRVLHEALPGGLAIATNEIDRMAKELDAIPVYPVPMK